LGNRCHINSRVPEVYTEIDFTPNMIKERKPPSEFKTEGG